LARAVADQLLVRAGPAHAPAFPVVAWSLVVTEFDPDLLDHMAPLVVESVSQWI